MLEKKLSPKNYLELIDFDQLQTEIEKKIYKQNFLRILRLQKMN